MDINKFIFELFKKKKRCQICMELYPSLVIFTSNDHRASPRWQGTATTHSPESLQRWRVGGGGSAPRTEATCRNLAALLFQHHGERRALLPCKLTAWANYLQRSHLSTFCCMQRCCFQLYITSYVLTALKTHV
jgi:hypothetical protein